MKRPAPSDDQAHAAWAEIMKLAEANALVYYGYGGVVCLATPEVQREQGMRERILRAGLFELEAEVAS